MIIFLTIRELIWFYFNFSGYKSLIIVWIIIFHFIYILSGILLDAEFLFTYLLFYLTN